MRKLFSLFVFALALLAGGAAAHAQDADAQQGGFYGTGTSVADDDDRNGVVGGAATPAPNDPAAQKKATSLPAATDMGPGMSGVMTWIMSLFAWLLGVAAITLDYAVYYTVVGMGKYVNDMDAIGVAWRIMRDFGNIVLIFGFLAIGLATILRTTMYGWTRTALPMLLVCAVFLNFSLFFAEAIVDTGNLVATQVYSQITPPSVMGNQTSPSQEGISSRIMSQLGLQTIYSAGNTDNTVFKASNSLLIGFMGILLFIVAAFVMFALAFILIARFVRLVYLIIISPIGIAGWAVPKLNSISQWWFKDLLTQTAVAPVLLITLYVALAVITDARFVTGFGGTSEAGAWVGFASGNYSAFASILLSFLVAMGLLLFVVILSNRMSAWGGDWATKTAGKLSFGIAGGAGRITAGWGANRAAKYLRTTRFARVPLLGTGVVKGFEKVAGASFDARGVKIGGGLKALKMGDLGDPQKGGYKADLKARTETRTKYAEGLKGKELTKNEKVRLAVLQNQLKKHEKDKAEAATEADYRNAETAIKRVEEEMAPLEAKTDAGAKKDYANWLNLRGKPDNFFNKYINFASNTDAAKKIRDDIKKDPELEKIKKLVGSAAGGAPTSGTPPATPPAPGTPPAP